MKRMILNLLFFLFISLMMIQGLSAKDKDPLSGENLFKDVVHYSNLGDHRTATPTDKVTAIWIRNRLKQAGFDVQTQEWNTRQFYPQRTNIIIDKARKIDAFPVWWQQPTSPQGIEAQLTEDINNVKGKILLYINKSAATFSVSNPLVSKINTAYANGAMAVIVVTYYQNPAPPAIQTIASDEFIGLNAANAAQVLQDAWPIPVVSAMARDQKTLDEAILNQSNVKVVSSGIYDDQAKAWNVIGALDRGPGSKVMVVSTPYSGWFTCAGERGGGVAIFLGLAEWAAKNTSDTTWIFAATSGHEINGLGIKHYLNSDIAPLPAETFSWAHIGAWQAMYSYVLEGDALIKTDQMDGRALQYTNDPSLKAVVDAYFSGLNLVFSTSMAYGDLVDVSQYGYKNLFGITGSHEYHHSTQDLPHVTGPELLEPVARAYQEALKMLMESSVE